LKWNETFEECRVTITVTTIDRNKEGFLAKKYESSHIKDNGAYLIEIDVLYSETILSARAEGYKPLKIPLRIEKGKRNRIDVEFTEKGGILQGRIIYPPGEKERGEVELRIEENGDDEDEDTACVEETILVKIAWDGSFQCICLDHKEYVAVFSRFEQETGKRWSKRVVFIPDLKDLTVEVGR
jgi:hypothetical protein